MIKHGGNLLDFHNQVAIKMKTALLTALFNGLYHYTAIIILAYQKPVGITPVSSQQRADFF